LKLYKTDKLKKFSKNQVRNMEGIDNVRYLRELKELKKRKRVLQGRKKGRKYSANIIFCERRRNNHDMQKMHCSHCRYGKPVSLCDKHGGRRGAQAMCSRDYGDERIPTESKLRRFARIFRVEDFQSKWHCSHCRYGKPVSTCDKCGGRRGAQAMCSRHYRNERIPTESKLRRFARIFRVEDFQSQKCFVGQQYCRQTFE
jgi:ABC-type sulfate transport system substrate-binding protein